MHVVAIIGSNTSENRKAVLSQIKKERKSVIVEFYEKGDRKLHKKIEKYRKKHPRAVLKNFE